jgi:hypothetical protein
MLTILYALMMCMLQTEILQTYFFNFMGVTLLVKMQKG